MLECGFDDVARKLARFANAQPADGISGKSNVDGSIGRLAAQLTIRPALHNAKKRLRVGTGLCPVQAGRSPASTRSSAEGTAAPRHLAFVLLKIFLAALRPAQRQFHRGARALPIRRILRALIK